MRRHIHISPYVCDLVSATNLFLGFVQNPVHGLFTKSCLTRLSFVTVRAAEPNVHYACTVKPYGNTYLLLHGAVLLEKLTLL